MSEALTDVMDRHTKHVLRETNGNITQAADRLEIARRTLQRWRDDGETFRRKVPRKARRK